MVYVNNTTDVQIMYIPKSVRDANGKVYFSAYSTMNLQGFSFHSEEEESSSLYHLVAIELPNDIKDGEYEYTLSDNNGILSTGLLVIGGLSKAVEYKNEIQYEQYSE